MPGKMRFLLQPRRGLSRTANPQARGDALKAHSTWFDFLMKEWLLLASASGLILTSVYFKRLPSYSIPEIQVLFLLFVLFVAVKGLEHSGLMLKLSKRIERGQLIPLKLVIATFCLSMLVTNDVALIIIVPPTLMPS